MELSLEIVWPTSLPVSEGPLDIISGKDTQKGVLLNQYDSGIGIIRVHRGRIGAP